MKKLIILSALLFSFIACKEDFTELPAVGALSDDALQNVDGVNLLLTGAYSALDGQRLNNSGNGFAVSADNWWADVIADDAHKGSTDGDQADLFLIETLDWTSANPYFLGRWNSLYAGVNRANSVISLINKIEGEDLTTQLAEARFLRAIFNFDLQKMWVNVPYISEENFEATEFNQANTGPIWDQIEADLQFAIDNLDAAIGQKGRANAWVARAFLGKAHLYQGDFANALTELTNVIDNGPFDLLPEFVDNFRLAGENGVESVFAVQFTADAAQSFNGNTGSTLNFPGGGPFGSCCGFYQPTQDLVNAYQTDASGLPLLTTFNQTDVVNDYGLESFQTDADGNVLMDADDNPIPTAFTLHAGTLDPRLDFTIGRRGIDYNGWGVNPGKVWIRASFADISGPYLPKKSVYHQGDDANQGTGAWGQQHSGINYHLMRFADVLLMAAEAAAEEGDITTALAHVNRVRARAMTMTPVQDEAGDPAANYNIGLYTAFTDANQAVQAVRFERRLEFGMEGHRLFDLRRWGIAAQVMNDYFVNESRVITSFSGDARQYEAKHDTHPIPVNAIDLSGNIISQNTGW